MVETEQSWSILETQIIAKWVDVQLGQLHIIAPD